MALVYLPEHVWSTRYGPDYFTVSIIGYRVFDGSFAQFELQVQTGKRYWTVLRRFSEFDKLRFSLRFKGGDRLPPLPPKTFCCRDLNPEFLSRRKDQLQKFLHDLLVIPSVSDDAAVREFLHLQASKAMFV